jgi:hypothetical protein
MRSHLKIRRRGRGGGREETWRRGRSDWAKEDGRTMEYECTFIGQSAKDDNK